MLEYNLGKNKTKKKKEKKKFNYFISFYEVGDQKIYLWKQM
jgi:hypothetical protein